MNKGLTTQKFRVFFLSSLRLFFVKRGKKKLEIKFKKPLDNLQGCVKFNFRAKLFFVKKLRVGVVFRRVLKPLDKKTDCVILNFVL